MINNSEKPEVSLHTRNTGCKIEYPSSEIYRDLWDEQTCNKIWVKAKLKMEEQDPNVHEKFKEAHRILLNGKYCYKPELFISKGWCEVAQSPRHFIEKPPRWGFCSTSCNIEFMRVIGL